MPTLTPTTLHTETKRDPIGLITESLKVVTFTVSAIDDFTQPINTAGAKSIVVGLSVLGTAEFWVPDFSATVVNLVADANYKKLLPSAGVIEGTTAGAAQIVGDSIPAWLSVKLTGAATLCTLQITY